MDWASVARVTADKKAAPSKRAKPVKDKPIPKAPTHKGTVAKKH